MKIAVLSTNADLYSTRRLVEAIKQKGHQPIVIDHTKCFVMIEGGKPSIVYKGKPVPEIDAAIPRIGTSVSAFGCAVVRQLELMKIFTTVKSQAILRSRDKLRSMQVLAKAGIDIPKTVFAKNPSQVNELIHMVGGPPVVIKLLEGTQGVGVVLAETIKAAKSTIEAFYGLRANFLIQEYVAESKGADIRAFVIGNKVIAAMRRQGADGDFRSNLHRGGQGSLVELTPEEEETAVAAAKALGVKIAGVDMLQSDRGPLVMEVNSSPGLRGIEEISGIDIAALIVSYIEDKIVTDEGDTVGV
ncbi:30S ribosomal protein S6--L-glutamate ligase [Dyadobacter aurulentus]|uniref:30S ribosomal protein S6--L-glutamate ligase n=1 Tax=Dyadobacter sp. UC 10 TaxID=2605428 RepID=UPI0011F3D2D8|nr:30S ribosomal protein S6--L-glutamate ligase [Dyadobacter sp. UC 10]KAA0990005.1 30S ribosomal protein S6--L-glutamate ligase [Dyadobacter sp. UC 10]